MRGAPPSWQDEARNLPPPTAAEINDWAGGVVCARLSSGIEVFYDDEQKRWCRVRSLGPGKN